MTFIVCFKVEAEKKGLCNVTESGQIIHKVEPIPDHDWKGILRINLLVVYLQANCILCIYAIHTKDLRYTRISLIDMCELVQLKNTNKR